jgi:bifunctional non-homologous end joining protein LigD
MPLDEYKRKRRFESTPEPPPEVEKLSQHRFVVQRHAATRTHYDFRLELEGVLKSWAVPKGPSLDPADKRLAMQVEDHPVSYFDFEGVIPEGNYGAGTVMVWDVGTWQPLSPKPVQGKFVPGTDAEALSMLTSGDLKFRLDGQKIKGDFAIVRMRSRRPGSKGTEWLLIKKRDEHVVEGYDAENDTRSVLTKRTMDEIAEQKDAQWVSRPAGRGKLKAAWLADAVAKLDQKKHSTAENTENPEKTKVKKTKTHEKPSEPVSALKVERSAEPKAKNLPSSAPSAISAVKGFPGARRAPMPTAIHPMLATPWEEPFDSDDWLFEIKWDGYRAVAFIADGKVRLVSRNQNDLTSQYSELADMPKHLKAGTAILDGEIVALDDEGRSSFSLMQQRTGFSPTSRRRERDPGIPVRYYAFDLLYLDGYDLRKAPLESRKQKLASLIQPSPILLFSDHYPTNGKALFAAAHQKGLEGILAKRRTSTYEERRSTEWRKIKITHRLEAVVGGYTEPQGSREHFGSLVLGLYDKAGTLIHIGQAGSGFTQKTQKEVWELLKPLKTSRSPFSGKVEALRAVHWLKPQLVAEIKFGEWTHEGQLRAPVFLGLRNDKSAEECVLEGSRV